MRQGARNPKLFGSSYIAPPRPSNRSRVGKSWQAIIVVTVIVGAVIVLGNLPIWRLNTVELLGDKNEEIAGRLPGLLGQSIFSSAVSRLTKTVRGNLAVSDFVCRRGLPATLRCNLTLRAAEIIWKTGETQYLVDKHGLLFAVQSSPSPELLTVEDTQHQPVSLGSVVVSPEIISQFKRLVELLKAKQLSVKTLRLNESLYQVTAIVERAGKTSVQGLFLLSGDVNGEVQALAAILATSGDSVTERIDVRVPGYVYTK